MQDDVISLLSSVTYVDHQSWALKRERDTRQIASIELDILKSLSLDQEGTSIDVRKYAKDGSRRLTPVTVIPSDASTIWLRGCDGAGEASEVPDQQICRFSDASLDNYDYLCVQDVM